jgi:heme/copper-type cytochrome/quinol oxidase subunit 1
MDKTLLVNLVTIAVIGGIAFVGYRLKQNLPVIGKEIKNNLFTLHGIVIAVLYNVFCIGLFCSYALYRLNVGEPLGFYPPSTEAVQEALKGAKKNG